ncbi:hypothetical protein A0H81_02590 [Grifola frondosa]|uniref:RING-type domain-containing protein n=1 Tax=Grifola frondosa TaxID=5627 RepID=A0A1C7MK56_GRIFR|nr:hypothetical protein A0H81_02590 [Grifola frondosa]
MYYCQLCPNKTFSTLESYEQHASASSVHVTSVTCHLCNNRTFAYPDAFIAHCNARHPPVQYRCTQCSDGFNDPYDMIDHMSWKHPLILCEPCGQTYYQDEKQQHLLEYSTVHPMCSVCGLAFVTTQIYIEHATSAHPEMCCLSCNKQFRSVGELQEHYKTSDSHRTCRSCDVGFSNDKDYDQHMNVEHPATQKIETAETESSSGSLAEWTSSVTAGSAITEHPCELFGCRPPVESTSSSVSSRGLTPTPPVLPYSTGPSSVMSTTGLKSVCYPSLDVSYTSLPRAASSDLDTHSENEVHLPMPPYEIPPPSPPRPYIPQGARDWPPRPRIPVSRSPSPEAYYPPPTDTPRPPTSSEEYSTRTPQTPKPKFSEQEKETAPPRSVPYLRCRAGAHPCVEPVATMCGHIFCKSCILKALADKYQCPTCDKAVLLRLDVD